MVSHHNLKAAAVLCTLPLCAQAAPEPVIAVFCLTDTVCRNSADNCAADGYSVRFTKFDDLSGVLRFDNGPDLRAQATTIAGQTKSTFSDRDGTWEFTHDRDQTFTLMRRAPNALPTYETYYAGTCRDQS
ncbi:hypothetical protein AQS8620_01531 [Aquimixticola soesokkakensis]|uniref:Uncharacterized protein n=1 Tax=Aquimixticola soesokkakensis TaxID=1519096 RepID=A0A1Y5SIJ1_9RHOB|nr:hypothetical protein [Aquimixticola soesokkakensis]SLN40446.1 hypothetical protein AQS8620_01531 [Aquimixticola soesokkakensis]